VENQKKQVQYLEGIKMVNMYFGLRTASYFIASTFPVITFIAILVFNHDIILASITAVIVALFSAILGRIITGNSFIAMLEGSGLIVLSLNSSGIVTPYLAKTDSKILTMNTKKGLITAVYDRTIGFYLKEFRKAVISVTKNTETQIETVNVSMPKEEFSSNYFKLMDKPMLIYNEKAGTFLSKQALCDLENGIMADYLSLVVLSKVDAIGIQLTALTKVFSDYFKPLGILKMLDNPFVKGVVLVVIIVALIFLVISFGPELMEILGDTTAIEGISGMPVTPIG